MLREATGAAHTFVLATHTFSAPHFMPDERLDGEGLAKKRRLQSLVADRYPNVRLIHSMLYGNAKRLYRID